MPHLEVNDLALVLDRPVMTIRGRGILERIKSSEMECCVTLDTDQSKWFYAYQVQPILKPMQDVNVASVTIKVLTEVALDYIRDGYDALDWLNDGRAILEEL